jgi:predicted dehydrogenase
MAERVRLIVAGAGAFGGKHIAALSGMPDVEIVGIADIRVDAAQEAAARHGVAHHDADAVALMERLRPDGLIVATPGATHVALAKSALTTGIPVLVEKPVGQNATEARSLAEAAALSSGFVLPGHILRFSEAHRTFVGIARSAEIGPVLSVTARRHRDDSHAVRYADDPVLMTMIHDIDLALWITGARPVDVLANRRPPGTSRSETLMTATDENGAVWRLSTAWTFPGASCPPDRIDVIGERGSVELEVGAAIRVYGREPRSIDISRVDPDQPLRAELSYFVECIRSRKEPQVVTLAGAVAGLETADAVIASLKSGERVRP